LYRVLTYFGTIINEIFMLILNVGTLIMNFELNCEKGKINKYLWNIFSCFRPFWVWGV